MPRRMATHNLSLTRCSTGAHIARLKRASNWWSKGIGLLGQRALPAGEGLWLPGVASVHTLCMKFAIDLVFLDKNFGVMLIKRSVAPGMLHVGCLGAHHTLELGSGTLTENMLVVGDKCAIRNEH